MPNKTIGDLSEAELLKLRFAQEHLKYTASIFALNPREQIHLDILFSAAREFSFTCSEIGFEDHWREQFIVVDRCPPDMPLVKINQTDREIIELLDDSKQGYEVDVSRQILEKVKRVEAEYLEMQKLLRAIYEETERSVRRWN